jgi:MHS family proline/betaine transporter-like MFS transporter
LRLPFIPELRLRSWPSNSRRSTARDGRRCPYATAAAVFGGFAPFISVWLTNQFGSVMAPTVYVVAASAISLLVVLRMPETDRMPLA